MARVSAPGTYESDGKVGIPLLPDGDYEIEYLELSAKEVPSGISYMFKGTIMDKKDESDPAAAEEFAGRTYVHFFNVLDPDQYDEKVWKLSAARFKNFLNAYNITVSKDDSFDDTEAVTRHAVATIYTTKPSTNKNDPSKTYPPKNDVREWFALEPAPTKARATSKRK